MHYILPEFSLTSLLPVLPTQSTLLPFPTEKSRPARGLNGTQHNKLQQDEAHTLIARLDEAAW